MKTYIFASFDNPVPRWLRNEKRALQALSRNTNIDLKNAVFHHEPIGRGKSYPVYAIKNEANEDLVVWIPGIYNDAYRVPDPYSSNYTAIQYVPKKHLNIVDVVYVSKDAALKPEKEHYQDPRYDANGKYRGQTFNKTANSWRTYYSYRGDRYDKSGYQIPDPTEKLAKWYRDGKSSRLKGRLENVYQGLKELQAKIGSMDLMTTDPNDQYAAVFGNWIRGFADAVSYYRRFIERYKNRLEAGTLEPWQASSMIEDLRSLEGRVKYLQNDAKKL